MSLIIGVEIMVYIYRCSNENCTFIGTGSLRQAVGWKSSCCNKCDNIECPDFGECKCLNGNNRIFNGSKAIEEVVDYYKNNEVEIETFD